LEVLYEATGGPEWTHNENWLTDAPLGEWYGVEVDEQGNVVGLGFFANRLTGRIPRELGSLTHLEDLSLSRGNLTGPIPAELGQLRALGSLRLAENRLTDRIPPELGGLTNLRTLYLGRNELMGAIPPELGNLAHLWRLNLAANDLTGRIPPELGMLAGLEFLYLGDNDLTGPVPPEFGGLMRLRDLAVQGNADMSGVLPLSLTNLAALETFQTTGTALCAPSDAGFLEWLEGGPNRRVALCEGEPATAYLVQAVQSREFPVPLVAGEEALLRVLVTAGIGNDERLPPVRASFHLNGMLAHVVEIPGGPGSIPTEVDEGSLAASANAVVPADVVRPGLEMVVEVDPDGTLDPALGVTRRIPSTGRAAIDVREMPVPTPSPTSSDTTSACSTHPCGGTGNPDPAYPNADGSIGAWGYDFRDGGRVVRPSMPDLMSYCGPNRWISDYFFTRSLHSGSSKSCRLRWPTGPARNQRLYSCGAVQTEMANHTLTPLSWSTPRPCSRMRPVITGSSDGRPTGTSSSPSTSPCPRRRTATGVLLLPSFCRSIPAGSATWRASRSPGPVVPSCSIPTATFR
jgi:hypothetical protein